MYNDPQQQKELAEAIAAADETLRCLQDAQNSLNSAGNWGMVDLFGGGILTTAIKHGKMNDAQCSIETAKVAVQKLEKELADVNGQYSIDLNVGEFLSFADYLFDGVLMDFLVQQKIEDAKQGLSRAIAQISDLRAKLVSSNIQL